MNEDFIKREMTGAKDGLNPAFGEWKQRFDFSPIGRQAKLELRKKYVERIRSLLSNEWLYSGHVKVEFVFHLDVQKILETDQTADLDNLVKTGLDALAGPSGIYFDDTQVQCINAYWLDSRTDWFEITTSASPDDFVIKPQVFYEMPDGLYYPLGPRSWTDEGVANTEPIFIWTLLTQWEFMISQKIKIRHKIRQEGSDKLKAYHGSLPFATIQRGYHKSRVIEFDCINKKEWQSKRLAWLNANPTASPSAAINFIKANI